MKSFGNKIEYLCSSLHKKDMGKNKLQKFSDLEGFSHVFQLRFTEINAGAEYEMKGHWHDFFGNNNPIVLELGCGRGEYTVGLAARFPEKNYIGIDIKGARLWAGAKESLAKGMTNVAFVRTNIELLPHFFAAEEISEIWLTFPDPQMKKRTKRLTSTNLLEGYRQLLKPDGIVHLKTDSNFMFTYTRLVAEENNLPILACNEDIYQHMDETDVLSIKTYYEQQWLARGITIKYLSFVLKPQVDWKEPEMEIELDAYRSFGRNKRSSLELNN
jgi:tRNA (guanine-N7-)-methyltransferase